MNQALRSSGKYQCQIKFACYGTIIWLFTSPLFAIDFHRDFDVIIVGGSTAALASAVSAAQDGARVALLEPTDWIGGQITSSGVPAIDEAWHKLSDKRGATVLDVAKWARTPANMSPLLRKFLSKTGCPGACWVSRYCFEPRHFLQEHLEPLVSQFPKLTVFRETVIKRVHVDGERIVAITAIQRFPRSPAAGYQRPPSQALPDWYSADASDRFRKQTLVFENKDAVFVDATEWGEVLALSGAPYLVGVENQDGGMAGNGNYGQSITFGFVQEYHQVSDAARDANVPKPEISNLGFGDYRDKPNAWQLVWTYRRLKAKAQEVTVGDLSLQNWGYYVEKDEGGNDYPFGFLFLNQRRSKDQLDDWVGGVDLAVMKAAEDRAFGWHHWFKAQAAPEIGASKISLAKHVLGTGHGLSKLPYIRDTRRSIGLDGFLLTAKHLAPESEGKIAKPFYDRIALGAYPVDIHPLAGQEYPDYVFRDYEVAPFTVPFRALTNRKFDNLLVTGKTMAQSFLANSATRLHPTEWSTGTAAGVIAAKMAADGLGTRDILTQIETVQKLVTKRTPIDWTAPK